MTDTEVRFAAALSDMENPTKDSDNPHFKSRYASLGAVLNTVKPCLAKHGLTLYQRVEPWGDGWMLCTYVISNDGERLQVDVRPFMFKGTPQQNGSEETYLRRYALMCCMGLSAEDDDGNEASASKTIEVAGISFEEEPEKKENELMPMFRKAFKAWRDRMGMTTEEAMALCMDWIGKPVNNELTADEINTLLDYMNRG